MSVSLTRMFIAAAVGLLGMGVWPGSAALPPFQITIESSSPYYLPASATVSAGAPIQWDNPTASHHTVTHDGCESDGPCAFDSGSVAPNGSFALPSLPPGRYPYHCTLHPIMRGILTVLDPAPLPSAT